MMETNIQEAFKELRAHVVSEVLKLRNTFQDQSELIDKEIRTLSAEVDSIRLSHIPGQSPSTSSPACDPVTVSHEEKAPPHIRHTNTTDSVLSQENTQNNELSPKTSSLSSLSREPSPVSSQSQSITTDRDNTQDMNRETPEVSRSSNDTQEPRLPNDIFEHNSSHVENLEEEVPSERPEETIRLASDTEHDQGNGKGEQTEIGEKETDEAEERDGDESEKNDTDGNQQEREPRNMLSDVREKRASSGLTRQKNHENAIISKRKKLVSGNPPVKRLKRMANTQEPVNSSNKRLKTRLSTPRADLISLKGLEHAPHPSILRTEIFNVLLDRSQSKDMDGAQVLTRLFFAIASPDALYQLRDACISIREEEVSTIPQFPNGVAQTIRALDNLDIAASTNSILRRYHLTSLVGHCNEREAYHKSDRPERGIKKAKDGSEGYGRASSLALADLMAQVYPKLKSLPKGRRGSEDEYQRKLKSLKNRINSGRNWCLLQQKFSPGILALIPTGGDYKILNSEIEKLPSALFTVFLTILKEYRGEFLHKVSELVSQHIHDILYRKDLSWRYGFEKIDGDTLKKEAHDSPGLIQFCELAD